MGIAVHHAETDAEIAATFEVMQQLRPHLERDAYVPRIRSLMASDGLRLLALMRMVRPAVDLEVAEDLLEEADLVARCRRLALDDVDRPLDAGAKAARLRQDDPQRFRRLGHFIPLVLTPPAIPHSG